MIKNVLALLLILALITGGTLTASAYTLTGTGYVIKNEIISVVVPSTLDFSIDPLEIGGRGSVYSDAYPLVNFGYSDVILTFTNIEVIFANDTDFEPSSSPISERDSGGLKTAYLTLDFGNPEIPPIVLTDLHQRELPEIALGANHKQNSEYSLSVSGSVNAYSDLDWQSGDIQISLAYQLQSITEVEDAAELGQTDKDEVSESIEKSTELRKDDIGSPAADDSPSTDADLPATDDSPSTNADLPAADNSPSTDADLTVADDTSSNKANSSDISDDETIADERTEIINENRGAEQ